MTTHNNQIEQRREEARGRAEAAAAMAKMGGVYGDTMIQVEAALENFEINKFH
jgi:hypothetical protein